MSVFKWLQNALFGALFFVATSTLVGAKSISFEDFETLSLSGSQTEYLSWVPAFSKHPLFPYAQSNYLSRTLSVDKKQVINEFIERYQQAPFIKPLKVKWLHYLAGQNYRVAFSEAYEYGLSTKLDCLYFDWQLEKNKSLTAEHDLIADTWVSNKSLPKRCNNAFAKWREEGGLTDELVLKRVEKSVSFNNYRLARYLKRYLTDSNKYLVDLWIKAAKNPNSIYRPGYFLFHNLEELNILKSYSRKLAFANSERFYKWWELTNKNKFPYSVIAKVAKVKIDKTMAIALAVSQSPIALNYLRKIPDDLVDESVKQWLIAAALETNNWQLLNDALAGLPEHFQVDPAVVFWRAKAEMKIGDRDYSEFLLGELAERRDYYGFMAAKLLGQPANIRHEPLAITKADRKDVMSNDTFKRAVTLFKSNRLIQARSEWNYLAEQLADDEILMSAVVAAEQGWHDRPIFTLSQVDYLNDVELRFPLAFKELIEKNADITGLPASLLFAITRRESSFIQDAYSSAGAAGLMQIKPATASYLAKKRVSRKDLFKPENNIKYASKYLNRLLEKTDQHIVLAAASYNAGYNRVEKWLPDESMPAMHWIETIPYKETRNYVKAIVAYDQVYQHLLHQKPSLAVDVTSLQVEPQF